MKRRGFTLMEAIVSMGMFSLLAAALFMVLRAGTGAWLKVDTRTDAETSLRRVESMLLRDLEMAITGPAGVGINIQRVGPGDGYALWFQSALYYDTAGNPRIARDGEGNLYGVDYVLYYAVRPAGHSGVAHGYDCAVEGGDTGTNTTPGPNGDRYCPHKMLIRKVINDEDPIPAATMISAYCTRPNGYSLAGMSSEPNLDLNAQAPRRLGDVLIFWPVYEAATRRLTINLAGFRTREAEKSIKVGGSRMDLQPFMVPHRVVLYPAN